MIAVSLLAMNPLNSKLSFGKLRTLFFFGLIVLLGLGFLYILRPFFFPLFWAGITAIMFYPFYTWVNKHVGIPAVSSLISVILVLVAIFLPISIVAVLLIQQTADLYNAIANIDLLANARGVALWLEGSNFAPYVTDIQASVTEQAANLTRSTGIYLLENVKNITQNAAKFLGLSIIMLYILYYLFKDGKIVLNKLMELSPLGDKYETLMYEKFRATTAATLKSTFIIGGIQGTLGGILFAVVGIKGAFIWAVIMLVLSVIPAVGPTIVWLPAALFMFFTGNIWQGVVLVIGGLVISTIDNLIRPPLIGKDTEMHPLIVFLSTLGGIATLGISGFIIGPIIAALFLSIITIYNHYYRHELDNN